MQALPAKARTMSLPSLRCGRGFAIVDRAVTQGPEPSSCSDAQLAAAILEAGHGGAAAAEAELCRRFAPRVRQYGLRHLRADDAAAELVQRVLLVTLEKLRCGGVREPERIASFVLGTARLTARAMSGRERRGTSAAPEASIDNVAAPDASERDSFASDQLRRCVEALSERERLVVVLTYYQDCASDEIAGTLAMTEGNVRVLRHRALARVRDCMGLRAEAAS